MNNQKINTGYLTNLVSGYRSKITDAGGIADIITFAEASWGLKFNLFPMQKLILKVLYGLELDDAEKNVPLKDELNMRVLDWFTEKEMMDFLISEKRTNLKEYVPGTTRRELVLCCGRRASKSSIISLVCSYEAYRMVKMMNPQAYFGFPSGWEIDITTVASVDTQAATLFGMIKNLALDCAFFKGRVDGDTQSHFSLFTDEDINVGRSATVKVYCGGAGSSALRSKNNLVVVMDEAAFFANFGKSSAESVWKALTPSVASFVPKGKSKGEGKIITLSSPTSKSGFFWDKVCESYDYPEDILMFQMYSSLININIDPSLLRSAQRRDKGLFMCEYCGEFSDTVAGWCSLDDLKKSIVDERTCNLPKGDPGISYYMGIDYGGKNDGTSVSICHKEDDAIVLDYTDVFYSKSSDVWESVVGYYGEVNHMFAEEDFIPLNRFADEIKDLCERFNVVEGWFDQYNGYGLMELLKERGMEQFTMRNVTQTLNVQVYQTTKELLNTGFLKLFNHPVLIPELASLEECRNGASVRVEAPQRAGFHDDISDSFARAVYSAHNSNRDGKKAVTLGRAGLRQTGAAGYKAYQMNRIRQFGGIDPSVVKQMQKLKFGR